MGVLSNKPDNVARDIVRTMFGPLVDQAHGQRAEFPTKPDPAAVLQMAADFGVERGGCSIAATAAWTCRPAGTRAWSPAGCFGGSGTKRSCGKTGPPF